ncbi:MAG: hypothetical protein QOH79_3508 [Acidimicrobiaceae bacterium]|jgi:hypothetical protein
MSDPSTQGAGGAGWHPDPSGRHQLRYWDGQTWTANVSDGGQQTTDAFTGTPAPTAGGRPARGPIGSPTNAGTAILLSIVTLGIYTLVWTYRQFEDFKKYSGEGLGGGLGLVLGLFTGGVTTYFLIPVELKNNLYDREGQPCPVEATIGLWFLLPIVGSFIWYLKVQEAINDFWIQRGAPAP